jgi:GT2 family glycosyltransferase
MTIAVGILTHNAKRYDRLDLLRQTIRTLAAQSPDALYVVDNGSDDGTQDFVFSIGGTCVADPITSCGHGMNVVCGILADSGCDVAVFSNDDIAWKADALERIEAFWAEAPADLVIASGLLEDEFPWNTIYGRIEVGAEKGLVRRTAPGGAWTFRAADWDKIAPIPEAPTWDDVPTCLRLGEHGYRVAQFDWARHLGEKHSTWGNNSQEFFSKPLNRKAWRV